MNKQQYYLTKLAEEASELAQIAVKTSHFGVDSYHPVTLQTNKEALIAEIVDVLATIKVLQELIAGIEPSPEELQELLEIKWEKMERYRKLSVQLGKSTND